MPPPRRDDLCDVLFWSFCNRRAADHATDNAPFPFNDRSDSVIHRPGDVQKPDLGVVLLPNSSDSILPLLLLGSCPVPFYVK